MNTTQFVLLGAVFVGTGLLAGCGSLGHVGVEAELKVPGVAIVKISFDLDNPGPTKAKITSSEPICLEVCYSNDAGEALECFTLQLPNEHDVPEGATKWSATVVDCRDGESAGTGGPVLTPPGQSFGDVQARGWRDWTMLGGAIRPSTDGTMDISYILVVTAPSLAQAKVLRDMLLMGGLGSPLAPGIQVLWYVESGAELDAAGLTLGVITRQALVGDDFASFELTINDQVFADLGVIGNLIQYGAGNGWNVVETFVPMLAIDTSEKFDNKVLAAWSTIHTQDSNWAKQRMYAR